MLNYSFATKQFYKIEDNLCRYPLPSTNPDILSAVKDCYIGMAKERQAEVIEGWQQLCWRNAVGLL